MVRRLSGGDIAIALYNEEDTALSVGFSFKEVGASSKVRIRDLWAHEDLGKFKDSFPNVTLAAHETKMLRLKEA